MTAFWAWVFFPLVTVLVTLGLGLLVEAATGRPLPGTLLLPLGTAALVSLTQLTTWSGSIAPATTPIIGVAAIAGLVIGRRRIRSGRLDRWAAAAAALVFLAYLAPVAFSGHPGWAGYALLGDTSVHFELATRMLQHGASAAGLAPSSYQASLLSYFVNSYPTGTHTALGALSQLVPVDLAWVYQSFLAWMTAMAALAFWEIAGAAPVGRLSRATIAFVAAQPGLVYALAMQGSIKEIGSIAMIATLFALVRHAWHERPHVRQLIPLATAAAAVFGVIDVAAAAWVGPAALVISIALLWRVGRRAPLQAVAELAVGGVAAAVLALPTLTGVASFVHGSEPVLKGPQELGDLLAPLPTDRVLGVWPSGDFRLPFITGTAHSITYMLMGVVLVCVLLGVVAVLRWGNGVTLIYAGVSALACWLIVRQGSPWADVKALAIFSPAVLLVAGLGAASAGHRATPSGRLPSIVLLAAVAAGVVWTNALAYHDVQLPNYDRLRELQRIGDRFHGQGPSFYPEFEEYAKYFLRRLDPTGGTESFQPTAAQTNPGANGFGFSNDIDAFQFGYIEQFRTLVLRRGPMASRPPSNFRLVQRGDYYDVWQRQAAGAHAVTEHLPLGDRLQRGSVVPCPRLRQVAASAPAGSQLAWSPAPFLVHAFPGDGVRTPGWSPDGADPVNWRIQGPGRDQMPIHVPRAGRYRVWVEGSFARPLHVLIDQQDLGTVRAGLSPRGESVSTGIFDVPGGYHILQIVQGGGSLAPGNGSLATLIGPVTLEPPADAQRVVRRAPLSAWRSLCGQRLDWLEIVR